MRQRRSFLLIALFLLVTACSQQPEQKTHPDELKHFPLDSMEGIIARSGITLDREVSSDGKGSLRVDTDEPLTVRLLEVNDIDLDNARLTYQARLRTESVEGQVVLEMWCQFSGIGEYFSRSYHTPLTGTNDWTTMATPFFLKKGQNPDVVKLNLMIQGKGTVWIDDIRILKGPLS